MKNPLLTPRRLRRRLCAMALLTLSPAVADAQLPEVLRKPGQVLRFQQEQLARVTADVPQGATTVETRSTMVYTVTFGDGDTARIRLERASSSPPNADVDSAVQAMVGKEFVVLLPASGPSKIIRGPEGADAVTAMLEKIEMGGVPRPKSGELAVGVAWEDTSTSQWSLENIEQTQTGITRHVVSKDTVISGRRLLVIDSEGTLTMDMKTEAEGMKMTTHGEGPVRSRRVVAPADGIIVAQEDTTEIDTVIEMTGLLNQKMRQRLATTSSTRLLME